MLWQSLPHPNWRRTGEKQKKKKENRGKRVGEEEVGEDLNDSKKKYFWSSGRDPRSKMKGPGRGLRAQVPMPDELPGFDEECGSADHPYLC